MSRASHRPIHISWRIAAASLGFVAGTAAALDPSVQHSAHGDIWLVAAISLTIVAMCSSRRISLAVAILAGLLGGSWHGASAQQALKPYDQYRGQLVWLQGSISEDPNHGKRGDSRFQLANVRINEHALPGKVWVSANIPDKLRLKRRDSLQLQGKLGDGFGAINASMTNARLIAHTTTSDNDPALQFRDWFASGIRQAIPEPQASLGSGFLTGQHSDLPGNLSDELKTVGLTHAVVASGSNLTILIGVTRKIFAKTSKYTATMAGSLMMTGFVLMTGFSPSMSRAGLVAGLTLAAWYYGRHIHPFVILPLAAAVTVAIQPSFVWGDLGWYLSFAAFVGVLVLAPLLQHYFWGRDFKPGLITEVLIGTVAAQLVTMPVILAAFGTYTSYALLANLLVIPFIPLAMLLTFVAGVAGVAVPALATIAGWPASFIMQYMLSVIHWTANLPGASGNLNFSQTALIASYAGLIFVIFYLWRRTAHCFGQETNRLIGERT